MKAGGRLGFELGLAPAFIFGGPSSSSAAFPYAAATLIGLGLTSSFLGKTIFSIGNLKLDESCTSNPKSRNRKLDRVYNPANSPNRVIQMILPPDIILREIA